MLLTILPHETIKTHTFSPSSLPNACNIKTIFSYKICAIYIMCKSASFIFILAYLLILNIKGFAIVKNLPIFALAFRDTKSASAETTADNI